MQRPPLWAAKELLLHMADETVLSIEHVKEMSSYLFHNKFSRLIDG
jgi:hypothetical protein